ncbi:MAG TPA: HAMP domain-containing sensor histidine kinase [Candidatus Saccharimonadales bacterium]|nr:HAMP domain-containing sensor histidine kinase [Candidatus Saccharimonadales bacterium]
MRRGPVIELPTTESVPASVIASLLDLLEQPILVSDRFGRILQTNVLGKQRLGSLGFSTELNLNLFVDLLRIDPKSIANRIEGGEQQIDSHFDCCGGAAVARIQWLPEADWLVVRIEEAEKRTLVPSQNEAAATQHTVQELLQEREITYRNLLAAYLRLQEVNRQKTVFLASAAHELKTPLAVIKGYYDLLLSGSLGKLTDKQRDILQESKDSCERLVRLVSMFLNYSALESGKLVLHLRENDLRDCLSELATRWHEAFVRKHVRLETILNADIPIFKFDYQKVQQTVANLLDNSLKHTPAGGNVIFRAELYFWERRTAEEIQTMDRRRERTAVPNCIKVSVSDSGPGIASEHHQEIFEDFVRVDRTSSGMGLGLAIAKRLVQAHRGKIWVESEPRRGCTFTFLLPIDNT